MLEWQRSRFFRTGWGTGEERARAGDPKAAHWEVPAGAHPSPPAPRTLSWETRPSSCPSAPRPVAPAGQDRQLGLRSLGGAQTTGHTLYQAFLQGTRWLQASAGRGLQGLHGTLAVWGRGPVQPGCHRGLPGGEAAPHSQEWGTGLGSRLLALCRARAAPRGGGGRAAGGTWGLQARVGPSSAHPPL